MKKKYLALGIIILFSLIYGIINYIQIELNSIHPYKTEKNSSFEEFEDFYELEKKETPSTKNAIKIKHYFPALDSSKNNNEYKFKNVTILNNVNKQLGIRYGENEFKFFYLKHKMKTNILVSHWNDFYIFKIDMGFEKENKNCYKYYLLSSNGGDEIDYCYNKMKGIVIDINHWFGKKHFGPFIMKFKNGYIIYDKRYDFYDGNINNETFIVDNNLKFLKNIKLDVVDERFFSRHYVNYAFNLSNNGCKLTVKSIKSTEYFEICK